MNVQQVDYSQYLQHSERWQELRLQALWRDRFACRLCNRRYSLHVHHRRYARVLGHETVDDLTTLCEMCHEGHHKRWRALWRSRFRWFLSGICTVLLLPLLIWILGRTLLP